MDESFDDRFQQFFKVFSGQLFQILPPGARAGGPRVEGGLADAAPASGARARALPRSLGPPPPAHTHLASTSPPPPRPPRARAGTNIEAAYAAGTDEQQAFVQNLALFYTSFLRVRLTYLSTYIYISIFLIARFYSAPPLLVCLVVCLRRFCCYAAAAPPTPALPPPPSGPPPARRTCARWRGARRTARRC